MPIEQALAENTAAIRDLIAVFAGAARVEKTTTASTAAVTKTEPAESTKPSEKATPAAAEDTGAVVDFDTLKKDFLKLSTMTKNAAGEAFSGRKAVEELLQNMGVAKLSGLVEDQWAAAHKFITDKLAA